MRTIQEIFFATMSALFKHDHIREYGKVECSYCHKHKPVTKYEAKDWNDLYYFCDDCIELLGKKH